MNRILKYSSILILFLYLGQIAEKVIPHSHHEEDGVISLDFSKETNHSEDEKEAGEKLHSSFYQLSSDNISINSNLFVQSYFFDEKLSEPIRPVCNCNYNILPKVLNSILFIIHTYASKAPPSF